MYLETAQQSGLRTPNDDDDKMTRQLKKLNGVDLPFVASRFLPIFLIYIFRSQPRKVGMAVFPPTA